MSKKNNVISAIKSSWKDLQKSLTEFSYDKLAQQDSSFSNQVLNTLYEISLKEMPNPPKGCKINKYDVIIEIE